MHAGIGDQSSTHECTFSRQELEGVARHAGSPELAHGLGDGHVTGHRDPAEVRRPQRGVAVVAGELEFVAKLTDPIWAWGESGLAGVDHASVAA